MSRTRIVHLKFFIVAWLLLPVLIASANAEQAASCDSTSCTFRIAPGESIQTVIDSASPGAEICLAPGVYTEDLTIIKPIRLTGEGQQPSDVLLVGSENAATVMIKLMSYMPDCPVQLRNLSIRSDQQVGTGVIVRGASSAEIRECQILGSPHLGVWMEDTAQVEIVDTTISANGSSREGGMTGIWVGGTLNS